MFLWKKRQRQAKIFTLYYFRIYNKWHYIKRCLRTNEYWAYQQKYLKNFRIINNINAWFWWLLSNSYSLFIGHKLFTLSNEIDFVWSRNEIFKALWSYMAFSYDDLYYSFISYILFCIIFYIQLWQDTFVYKTLWIRPNSYIYLLRYLIYTHLFKNFNGYIF